MATALRRLGQGLLVVWAVFTLAFVLLNVLPGDPIRARLSDPATPLTPEQLAQLQAYYGLDQPLWVQYLQKLSDAVRLDFGYSIQTGTAVSTTISETLPSTLQLSALAIVIGILVAGAVSLLTVYSRWQWLRSFISNVPPLFASVPTFLIGILFLQLFAFGLRWLPAVDDGSFAALLSAATVIGLAISAPLAQVTSSALHELKGDPFVVVARTRGASEPFLLVRHIARNLVLPVLTMVGVLFGELLAGSLVTEAIFSRQGLGSITVSAIQSKDFPVLQAVVVIVGAFFVLVNFLVDMAYIAADPRISLRSSRKAAIA